MIIYNKKSLYLWILFFTGVASILLNAFVLLDIENSIIAWLVLSILAIFSLDEKNMQKFVDVFKSDDFSKTFDYYFKCFLLNLGLTIFLTITIIVFYNHDASSKDVSIASYSIFIFLSLLIHLNKKFNVFRIKLCESKKKVNSK